MSSQSVQQQVDQLRETVLVMQSTLGGQILQLQEQATRDSQNSMSRDKDLQKQIADLTKRVDELKKSVNHDGDVFSKDGDRNLGTVSRPGINYGWGHDR